MTQPRVPTLRDLVVSVRSKNAGPFSLTFDLFFDDDATFARVVESGAVTAARVAALYRVDPAVVQVHPFAPARAIKVSLPRAVPGGDPADTDVAGGQQFVPLLALTVPDGRPATQG